MSDLDDLRKLQQRLDAGEITRQEYDSERAWITGSVAGSAPETVTPAAARPSAGGHVIDLHEIKEQEKSSVSAKGDAGREPGQNSGGRKSTAAHKDADDRKAAANKTAGNEEPRGRQLPTVWKAILIAFVVWILLLATAVVYLRLSGNGQGSQTTSSGGDTTQGQQDTAAGDAGEGQSQQGSVTAQNAAQELQDASGSLSYENFIEQLERILGTYYGENYTVADDGKTLTISLMGEGIAADAMYVVQGADGAAQIWDELKASMQTLAVTCFDGANADTPERHVVLNILNDQNAENVILSYLDGQCIYDATQGGADAQADAQTGAAQ